MTTSPHKSGKRLGLWAALLAFLGAVVFFQLRPSQPDVTTDDVQAALVAQASVPAQADFFAQLGADFPDEFAVFLQAMADAANSDSGTDDEASYGLGVAFTQKLRRDNASFFANAPTDALRDINVANLTVLEKLAEFPEICARFALTGGAGLSFDQVEKLDMTAMTAVSSATFKAMVVGRETPVIQPTASDADIVHALTQWAQQPHVTEDMNAALTGADPMHPDQCVAQTSFQRFIVESDDPAVIRAMVRMVTLAVAG